MVGVLGLIGWKVTVISSNFLALMLIITISMNIHLIVRYLQLHRDNPGDNQLALVKDTTHKMVKPCLYTALTTIIGMIPLTLRKSSDMGMSYNSFGLTLIGGMISGTLLTLLVVPVFYTLLDDAQLAIQNTLASVMRPQAKPSVVK